MRGSEFRAEKRERTDEMEKTIVKSFTSFRPSSFGIFTNYGKGEVGCKRYLVLKTCVLD